MVLPNSRAVHSKISARPLSKLTLAGVLASARISFVADEPRNCAVAVEAAAITSQMSMPMRRQSKGLPPLSPVDECNVTDYTD